MQSAERVQQQGRSKDPPGGGLAQRAPSPLQELPPSPRAQEKNPKTQKARLPAALCSGLKLQLERLRVDLKNNRPNTDVVALKQDFF